VWAIKFQNNPKVKQGQNVWVDKIFMLLNAIDTYIPTPMASLLGR
jgi:elongation factor Tu